MHPEYGFTREAFNARGEPSRMSRSVTGVRRLRSDESWIEVSSQASSSSVSSIPTSPAHQHGMNTSQDQRARRRRRLLRNTASGPTLQARTSSAATSSQEEYEESESESDHILSSSNENVPQLSPETIPEAATSPPSGESSSHAVSTSDDDDENATALGIGTNNERVFTPPANVFTRPPSSSTARNTRSLEARTSYFQSRRASQPRRTSPPRRQSASSYPSRRGGQHSPYNMISPSHQADHDAALRASLSTLLSCAAAARGLPKKDSTEPSNTQRRPAQDNRIQPSTFRLVPESSLPSTNTEANISAPRRRTSNTSLRENDAHKRKAPLPTVSSSKDRKAKKARATSPDRISDLLTQPTLLTWALSAGVLVVFSALSFSAGYAIGRDVGRGEMMLGSREAGCGREVGKEVGRGLRGLRRLGSGGGGVVRV